MTNCSSNDRSLERYQVHLIVSPDTLGACTIHPVYLPDSLPRSSEIFPLIRAHRVYLLRT